MDDSEKLTALKKAYADIILNTAKEAAARIMVSERKALRFQQELVSTKEEALRMLLRLKQMLDSKVNEAEMMSFSQQKKIEELEAQLQEAEEIVKDLREELREAQAELEKVANNQMNPPVEQNRPDPYDGCVYSLPDIAVGTVPSYDYDTWNSTANGTNDSSEFCVSRDHINNCYIHNPDFAPIIIRRKGPELYRNGCTQRIRAFERSLFDEKMSLSGNLDDVNNETLVRADEEVKVVPVATNVEVDITCEKEKPDEIKVVNADADHVKVPKRRLRRIDKIMLARQKRKALRKRKHSDQVEETNEASYLSSAKGSLCVLDNSYPSKEDSSLVYENEAQKDLISPFAEVPSDANAMGSQYDTGKGEVFLKACSDWNEIKDDKKLLDKSDMTGQESLSNERLEIPACRADVEAANESSNKLDPKVSDLDEEVKVMPVTTNVEADIRCEKEKPDELKVGNADADHVKVPKRRLTRIDRIRMAIQKRKAFKKRKLSDQVKETNKASYLSSSKGSPYALDNNDPSKKDSSLVYENEAQKDLMCPFAKVPSDANAIVEQSGSHFDNGKGKVFLKACSDQNKIKDDKELLHKLDLTRQESLSAASMEVPACRADVEAADESLNKLDPKLSDLDEKVSCESPNDKFLKYTFQRKRKKESLGSADVDCSLQNNSLKKKCGEKQNGHVEPQKSCTMTESSRDSRRLAQVARQLISLSEKKWWQ